jgi:hypothetical protein
LTEALTRFAADYGARDREEIVRQLKRHGTDAGPLPVRRIADQIHTVQPVPAPSNHEEGRGEDPTETNSGGSE